MFGIGLAELFVIFVVVLIVLGPERMPDLARTIGRVLREFKSLTRDLKDSTKDE